MHESDFQLVSREEQPDGGVVYTVLIVALGLTRQYLHNPAEDTIEITGGERKILIRGYDMTSIIGKRAREWIRSGH